MSGKGLGRYGLLLAVLWSPLASVTMALGAPSQPRACRALCAVSDDGVVYRVTAYFKFRDHVGQQATAVDFSITNRSHRAHVFAPLPGGFTALTRSGQYVQVQDYIVGRGCYAPFAIDPGASHHDPDQYRIRPGQTRTMKLMCMVVPSGQRLAKVQFADNDAARNAVVRLPHVANLRPSRPKTGGKGGPPHGGPGKKPPGPWWLPDPCQTTPDSYLRNSSGAGRKDWTLFWRYRDTAQANALCRYQDPLPVASGGGGTRSIYIGYQPPPEPYGSATSTKIAGWPGASLRISTRDFFTDPNWFYTVNFHRRFHGHIVYGQFWWQGRSCTSSEPYAAIVLKPLYDAFGPPGVSVPPRYPLPSPCYAPPRPISITTDKICPANDPTPCQAAATLTTTVLSQGRHAVAVAARAPRRSRQTVVVGTVTAQIKAGQRVAVQVRLNTRGRRLLQSFHRLPTKLIVKVDRRHRVIAVIRRKLTIRTSRIARR